jgi:hypothetical protein
LGPYLESCEEVTVSVSKMIHLSSKYEFWGSF